MSEFRLEHGCGDMGEDDEGWVYIVCDCGKEFGGFPDAITAVDELIDHVVSRTLDYKLAARSPSRTEREEG